MSTGLCTGQTPTKTPTKYTTKQQGVSPKMHSKLLGGHRVPSPAATLGTPDAFHAVLANAEELRMQASEVSAQHQQVSLRPNSETWLVGFRSMPCRADHRSAAEGVGREQHAADSGRAGASGAPLHHLTRQFYRQGCRVMPAEKQGSAKIRRTAHGRGARSEGRNPDHPQASGTARCGPFEPRMPVAGGCTLRVVQEQWEAAWKVRDSEAKALQVRVFALNP
jgi:hypothetical protein